MHRWFLALLTTGLLALPAAAQDTPAEPPADDGAGAAPADSGGTPEGPGALDGPGDDAADAEPSDTGDAEDPVVAADDEEFIPSEEIPADQEVRFPVDI